MPVFTTLEGKWKGGPNDNIIRVEKQRDGSTRGDWAGKNGGRAGFEGKLMGNGKELKGYWFDLDAGVTEGMRYACTIVVVIDEQGDPTGKTMLLKYKTKDGGSGEWSAKRFSETAAVPREGGKIATFNFRKKDIFDRLTENVAPKMAQMRETGRTEVLGSLEPHPWFDGAILYIAPPSVGDEYLNFTDMERRLKAMEAEAAAKYKTRLEEDLAKIKDLMAAGKGEVLKKRFNMDMDIAKRFVELYEKLLKGEVMAEKLKERHAFKPGLGPWHPDSEKPAEHLPDPYFTEAELIRKIDKDQAKHWAEFKTRLEAEIEALTKIATDSEKLKARGLDEDLCKRKLEIYAKLVKGETTAKALAERPKFKPGLGHWHPDSEKPVEHLPDKYFSAVELERELARRDKKHWEEFKARLEAEVEHLTKIQDDGEKLKKLALDSDGAKKRIDTLKRIIQGESKAAKLGERPSMKPNPPTVNFRMSGTVMLHPRNVRAMLRNTK